MHPQTTNDAVVLEHPQTRLIAAEQREARKDRRANATVIAVRDALKSARELSWVHDAIDAEHIDQFDNVLDRITFAIDALDAEVNQ